MTSYVLCSGMAIFGLEDVPFGVHLVVHGISRPAPLVIGVAIGSRSVDPEEVARYRFKARVFPSRAGLRSEGN